MAELPLPTRAGSVGPRVFPAVPLERDGYQVVLRRRDAQVAVDRARRDHIAARRALMSATVPAPRAVQTTAVDAAAVLRAAVVTLAALSRPAGDDPASLEVVVASHDDGRSIVVHPRGELDMLTSPQFEQACTAQLDTALPDTLTVDLSAVTFLDSSAMAVLVEIRRVALASGATFVLTGLTDSIRRLLEITRLDAVFEIV